MNDKIYEFATRAGLITFESIHDSMAVTPSIESVAKARKFAELIVRECIETMKRTLDTECINENEKYGCMYAIVDVKDHFGVHDDGDLTITFRS
jgi:hypothetical protein